MCYPCVFHFSFLPWSDFTWHCIKPFPRGPHTHAPFGCCSSYETGLSEAVLYVFFLFYFESLGWFPPIGWCPMCFTCVLFSLSIQGGSLPDCVCISVSQLYCVTFCCLSLFFVVGFLPAPCLFLLPVSVCYLVYDLLLAAELKIFPFLTLFLHFCSWVHTHQPSQGCIRCYINKNSDRRSIRCTRGGNGCAQQMQNSWGNLAKLWY